MLSQNKVLFYRERNHLRERGEWDGEEGESTGLDFQASLEREKS